MSPIYLSHFIDHSTPVYGGRDNMFNKTKLTDINDGATSNTSLIVLQTHIGTHIDFPYHFSNDGLKSHDYKADFWIFRNVGYVCCSIDQLEKKIISVNSNIEILIIKTKFGEFRGKEDYVLNQPVIPASIADLLKVKFPKLRAVGFDLISLTSQLDKEEGKMAHRSFLLKNNFLIIEDMKLDNLDETPELIIVAPLLVTGADGCPCTIIAY